MRFFRKPKIRNPKQRLRLGQRRLGKAAAHLRPPARLVIGVREITEHGRIEVVGDAGHAGVIILRVGDIHAVTHCQRRAAVGVVIANRNR
jgi:hypothetical protein